mmetsp:Transcript_5440/g.9512  ORF Transcript_5440/g.9512 Transcript_5440/m.9512 type:complete len:320 (+) Transcript_5440:44-1003(+)
MDASPNVALQLWESLGSESCFALLWISVLTISILYMFVSDYFFNHSDIIPTVKHRKSLRGPELVNIFQKSKTGSTSSPSHSLPETFEQLPQHVAVIMDGNRRYGKAKYNSVFQGHKDGADTLVDFMGWCIEFNIKTLTVYAFSTENWNRNEKEVSMLMGLITTYIDDVKKEAHEKDVRIRCISSDFERLPEEVRKCVLEAEAETAAHQRFTLNICLSYGGRHDLVTAARTLARRAAAGDLDPEHIDEAQLRRALATRAFAADPDLVLRTSGERRLSNFLPLEAAYAELVFLDALWPEVTRSDLAAALHEYGARRRRYGR